MTDKNTTNINPISARVKQLFSNPIISGSFFLTFGGFVINSGNYLFNLIMGRLLTTADYGTLVSLVYLTIIISLPSTMLVTVASKFTAHYFAQKRYGVISKILRKFTLYAVVIGVALFLLFILFSGYIGAFLHITDSFLISLAGVVVAISLINSANNGILQGLLKFRFLAGLGFVTVILKLVFGWVLVEHGLSVTGALIAIVISVLANWLISFIPLTKYLKYSYEQTIGLRKQILSFSLPTFSQTAALTLFLGTDLILVKHLFPADTAGMYAATSMMGKAIFYTLFSIAIVVFPIIAQRHAAKADWIKELTLSIFLVIGGGILALLAYILFPDFIVRIFFPGEGYQEARTIVGLYSVYMVLLSLAMLLVRFFLVIEKKLITHIALAIAMLQGVFIFLYHNTLVEVIVVSIVSVSILVTISGLQLGYLLWRRKAV